jgi:hypothetical protein
VGTVRRLHPSRRVPIECIIIVDDLEYTATAEHRRAHTIRATPTETSLNSAQGVPADRKQASPGYGYVSDAQAVYRRGGEGADGVLRGLFAGERGLGAGVRGVPVRVSVGQATPGPHSRASVLLVEHRAEGRSYCLLRLTQLRQFLASLTGQPLHRVGSGDCRQPSYPDIRGGFVVVGPLGVPSGVLRRDDLDARWVVRERIGAGGFGQVFAWPPGWIRR